MGGSSKELPTTHFNMDLKGTFKSLRLKTSLSGDTRSPLTETFVVFDQVVIGSTPTTITYQSISMIFRYESTVDLRCLIIEKYRKLKKINHFVHNFFFFLTTYLKRISDY